MTDFVSSVAEELMSDYEATELDAEWRAARERQERDFERQFARERVLAKRAAMLADLNAVDREITESKRAGKNTRRLEQNWLRLLGQYDALCRQIAGTP